MKFHLNLQLDETEKVMTLSVAPSGDRFFCFQGAAPEAPALLHFSIRYDAVFFK